MSRFHFSVNEPRWRYLLLSILLDFFSCLSIGLPIAGEVMRVSDCCRHKSVLYKTGQSMQLGRLKNDYFAAVGHNMGASVGLSAEQDV